MGIMGSSIKSLLFLSLKLQCTYVYNYVLILLTQSTGCLHSHSQPWLWLEWPFCPENFSSQSLFLWISSLNLYLIKKKSSSKSWLNGVQTLQKPTRNEQKSSLQKSGCVFVCDTEGQNKGFDMLGKHSTIEPHSQKKMIENQPKRIPHFCEMWI